MPHEQLKLANQLCFPFYAVSRLITRAYQPHLEPLGITYPQYLVLLVLWEKDEITVNEIAEQLLLQTNTLTPLLQRLEALQLIQRERQKKDERKVCIRLTEAGKALEAQAADIPQKLLNSLHNEDLSLQDLLKMKDQLCTLMRVLG